jgi:hypothetical protein
MPIAFENSRTTVGAHHDGISLALQNYNEHHIHRHRTDRMVRLPLFNLPITWNLLQSEFTDSYVKSIFVKSASLFPQ